MRVAVLTSFCCHTPSLSTQIGLLECGLKKGRQSTELPWECVNSCSRAGEGGRDGPEALAAFHSLQKNEGRNEIPSTIYWRAISQNNLGMY